VQIWSPGIVWIVLVGVSSLITIAPWLPPGKETKPAHVDLVNCNGCQRCADDCPFGAIDMMSRSDGLNYEHEAVVDAGLCVSCGICVGSCPTATPFRSKGTLIPGIDLPELPVANLRELIKTAAEPLSGDQRILTFSCDGSTTAETLRKAGEAVVTVKCMGQIPPPFLDYVLSRNFAEAVLLTGCSDGRCRYRFGAEWSNQRVERKRDPRLRKRVDDSRIARAWQDFPQYQGNVLKQLRALRASLPQSETQIENEDEANR
jgi:ferredoxin/coenzyme F420-reducing hydrogenase delta subunit